MKALEKLQDISAKKNSILCVGLDTDINKIPDHFKKTTESISAFNIEIIKATRDICAAYKVNFAFYEQYGIEGFIELKKTIDAIPDDCFIIADAKRGDIGNTSAAYAKSCFEYFNADSITVSPYMGSDSIGPFLNFPGKMVFILALTSNPGSNDFQHIESDGKKLYERVIYQSSKWADENSLGYVVGATHPDELKNIREIIPGRALLIPGVGAQGGDIEAVIKANSGGPALINVSRGIIYISSGKDFAEKVRNESIKYNTEFNKWL